jgi:hypothetical protein
MQGMIALALHRQGETAVAKKIIASLKENALVSEEMGMYWKDLSGGYYWYEAPVEAHALLIEAFTEIANDATVISNLKNLVAETKTNSTLAHHHRYS